MNIDNSKFIAYRLYENYKNISNNLVDIVKNKLRFARTMSMKAKIKKNVGSKKNNN